ncbi:hypothetical protein TWF718_003203 [Orbilia javanica]|uniref:Uncharacterized protein n=1 Tax=Orbilia javanica TaxID=47235 RepID=A0AAN8MFD9_9PEZI
MFAKTPLSWGFKLENLIIQQRTTPRYNTEHGGGASTFLVRSERWSNSNGVPEPSLDVGATTSELNTEFGSLESEGQNLSAERRMRELIEEQDSSAYIVPLYQGKTLGLSTSSTISSCLGMYLSTRVDLREVCQKLYLQWSKLVPNTQVTRAHSIN